MGSRPTKGTQRPITNTPSESSAPAPNTGAPLPVLKSTSRRLKGRFSEEIVIAALARAGAVVLASPFQTPFAEIDILAYHAGTLALIEVKSARLSLETHELVSPQQVKRLKQAHLYVGARFHLLQVRSFLVVVARGGELRWFSDFLS